VAVDLAITQAILESEIAEMTPLARSYGWDVSLNLPSLKVATKMRAHNGDVFIIEADFENYKEWPPLFEFIDPDSGARGVRRAYPQSTDSFFHSSGPCICAPFNRKAYKSVVDTGPHGDWGFGDWMTSKANNYDWSHIRTIGDMLSVIQTRIAIPDLYRGRMQ
jgi:hypothetical protein